MDKIPLSKSNSKDIDPEETQDWLDSVDSVISIHGKERAKYLLSRVLDHSKIGGFNDNQSFNTPYLNTISLEDQLAYPGDRSIEKRIESYIRWNAMAMVIRANRISSEYGGHIASYASSATLYEVGFNHFWRATNSLRQGDLVFFQGHSSPGIYARAFLEGRLSENQLDHFRQEISGDGLSSYPHPKLMPDFWQFPTVSMGLGPMMAIYQAKFMRYLSHREITPIDDRKIWCFLGDGEMDEAESLGAITMPVRENLDNLIFVINCNLQSLDGPVRGNGKIIQELESVFKGAGWNVIKLIWGSRWDPLLAQDYNGSLRATMEACLDGEYQNFKSKDGAYTREHFFGRDPSMIDMVSKMSDEDIWRLNRGGHDSVKVYSSYHRAINHKGGPTVILAKTVKGFGMGDAGEGQNITHQKKKLEEDDLKAFRDRFSLPITDKMINNLSYFKPKKDSEEFQYLMDRRSKLGGFIPSRKKDSKALKAPSIDLFKSQLEGTSEREVSTTMSLVRILSTLVRDKNIGAHIVPIIPDEGRTFGMEGMFRQVGIYSSLGQLYTPQDADQLTYYKQDKKGQILQEGINEAGAFCSWLAAGTSYSNNNVPMIPFYIFYSMFGFQRVGDFAWAGGDLQSRGFLIGGTAGRTTLAGEGLQHQDGHSQLVATTIPNCRSYDPCFSYELAVIIQDGIKRMYEKKENIFYYIACMNENYPHPPMPKNIESQIVKGIYKLTSTDKDLKVQMLGSGTILREVIEAAKLLESYGVGSDVWSVTSFSELRREALDTDHWNARHSIAEQKQSYLTSIFSKEKGPFIAATDYMKIVPDQVRKWIPGSYTVLGTDGFGRSDGRKALREFFEVDRYSILLSAINALVYENKLDPSIIDKVMKDHNIDKDKPNPLNA